MNQSSGHLGGIPTPPWANRLSADTIEISFPHTYDFSGKMERWGIERVVSPDNLVFSVIYKEKGMLSIPLGNVGPGTYKISGSINLGGVIYDCVSITLKKDIEFGTIQLKKTG